MRSSRFLQLLGIALCLPAALGSLTVDAEQVRAQTATATLMIEAGRVPDFWQLVLASEARVSQHIASTFAANSTVDRLQVKIVASRGGAVVPILMTDVSRQDWQRLPQVQSWTRYFETAQQLLGYATMPPQPQGSIALESRPIDSPEFQEQVELEDALD